MIDRIQNEIYVLIFRENKNTFSYIIVANEVSFQEYVFIDARNFLKAVGDTIRTPVASFNVIDKRFTYVILLLFFKLVGEGIASQVS